MLSLSPVPLRQLTSFLFRAEPPDAGGDFAAEDPLALDYIGQQIGLWILPRLTTRTNRAQAYAIVLYGLALADRAVREYSPMRSAWGRRTKHSASWLRSCTSAPTHAR